MRFASFHKKILTVAPEAVALLCALAFSPGAAALPERDDFAPAPKLSTSAIEPVTPANPPEPALVKVRDTAGETQPSFVARKQPVEQVLTAIGSAMGKPVLISTRARTYKVTGDFALDKPMEALDRVTTTLGMTWYFDGNAVYVYDGSESANVIMKAAPATVNALLAFLKQNALYDPRFPIKYTPQTRVLYLSAPPKYVEIVQSALSLMSSRETAANDNDNDNSPSINEEPAANGRLAVVVRVKHAFVGDRTYSRRDTTLATPGLATVLTRTLGGGTQLVIAEPPPPEPPPNTASTAPSVMPAAGASVLNNATNALSALLPPLPPPTTAPTPAQPSTGSSNAARNGLRIIAYPSQNSLILEGYPRQIDQAKRLIAQLDTPKTQIELSLWVIDISKLDADRLGVQWNADIRFGSFEARYRNTFGRDLFSSATLSGSQTRQFIAAIAALSNLDKARIVSRPMLLAQDNSRAIYDNSTSFYVKLEGERYASLDRVTYGTMIDVLPRVVSDNGRLEMEIAIDDGSAKTPDPESKLDVPIVSSTHIDTLARVLHDQSLLIGGYTHDESTENVNKIPLLGDIPYLGSLFRYRSVKLNQTVRLFLIQPRVLGDDVPFTPNQAQTPQEVDNSIDALKNYLEQRHDSRKQ